VKEEKEGSSSSQNDYRLPTKCIAGGGGVGSVKTWESLYKTLSHAFLHNKSSLLPATIQSNLLSSLYILPLPAAGFFSNSFLHLLFNLELHNSVEQE
jgi:hypothetical protein